MEAIGGTPIDNNSSPHGNFHRFLFPFYSKISRPKLRLRCSLYLPMWNTKWAWVTCDKGTPDCRITHIISEIFQETIMQGIVKISQAKDKRRLDGPLGLYADLTCHTTLHSLRSIDLQSELFNREKSNSLTLHKILISIHLFELCYNCSVDFGLQ